ncbi:pyruvate, phosphate dikinase [Nocardia otitidiscaviarum]|uniref:Pyruvate, phosphate dikinase n=1 Tax=Nocardia otitidiscaviarum TaxID=1823 RepID=A0A516NQF3_9NOCA|nr:pyruvate, phosphate dikinase [Nocardia otitidiscaviarum]MCP9620237.1 pyruvate, phosphate dikinase [Nocardia otitidiscaviarum]QDP81113.1 pyruvate, phosphate dikinase [Nocardia otitidiscaviarum]
MTAGAELAQRPDVVADAATVVELDGRCGLSRERIGGKAWSIDHMRALGLPVPPAFVITTDGWADYRRRGGIAAEIWAQVRAGIAMIERGTGRGFGGTARPLLVSVRSGAAVSMPGMMDTVLNLGMTDAVRRALAEESGNPAYADDTWRRFLAQYRETVLGDEHGVVPDDPWEQLRGAIEAVFRSWDSPRAKTYRRNRGVADTLGTAVTVQAMVFGNLDDLSGTGVLFSRNPNTGDGPAYGEWLVGGQGEDVVSGRTTPRPLDELAATQPRVHERLLAAAAQLERDGRDIQDIEFTVESGALWLLQSRPAKRSARAAVRAAVAMVDEGMIGARQALDRITPDQVREVLRPASGDTTGQQPLAHGESACPGLASGLVVTDPDEAEARAQAGEAVILVRPTTSPDDLHGMIAARAVVTELGGTTSHAALVSRELGRPCVVGCGSGVVAALAGRTVTVDGGAGVVWPGEVAGKPVEADILADVAQLATWAGTAPDGLAAHLEARASAPETTARQSDSTEVLPFTELELLRLVGIKGRVNAEGLAASLAAGVDEITARCADLVTAGLCATTPAGFRLTSDGRPRLERLLADERETVDHAAISAAYDEFCVHNQDVKLIITDWQMKDADTVNDHADADYDAAVLARLTDAHRRLRPLIGRLGDIAPRLGRYADRLDRALERIDAGDHTWVARPIMDSYHTVWFELHEDLIGLCGRNRAEEAAAGRAH